MKSICSIYTIGTLVHLPLLLSLSSLFWRSFLSPPHFSVPPFRPVLYQLTLFPLSFSSLYPCLTLWPVFEFGSRYMFQGFSHTYELYRSIPDNFYCTLVKRTLDFKSLTIIFSHDYIVTLQHALPRTRVGEHTRFFTRFPSLSFDF